MPAGFPCRRVSRTREPGRTRGVVGRMDHNGRALRGSTHCESHDPACRRAEGGDAWRDRCGAMSHRAHTQSLNRRVRRMNAIELLKADHARVQALFRQYEAAENQAQPQRALAEQIFTALEVHAALEEELFYP